jgi:transposase InsO family protein
VPRDHWLCDDEKERIAASARANPLEGYRRLTFMMVDADVVACSPTSDYRVLKAAGLLAGSAPVATKKGTGFVQPLTPHEHWRVDVSYLNIAGTFYFLCSVLDGCSRFIVHHEIREKMEESDVETILQRAREAHPGVTPRIISDNGPQFIAKDFKEFIRAAGMTHAKTSLYYPQSNGVGLPARQFLPRAAARSVPFTRFDGRHQPLLQCEPRCQYLPLLQMRTVGQCPRSVGVCHSPNALRCRPRSVWPSQHPRATTVSGSPEQGRGTRSSGFSLGYNAFAPAMSRGLTH